MFINVKNIVDEDFIQYKKPSMFVGFSKCNFKCGKKLCQNSPLVNKKTITISIKNVCERYIKNPITKAIVLGGLDPFDTPEECVNLCLGFRSYCDDDIVIYTGYTEEELQNNDTEIGRAYKLIIQLKNIIIKYGRYIPNEEPHYDEVLGIKLASSNQYAIKY